MNLTAIRTALAGKLQTAYPATQVSPYLLANPEPPALHLYPEAIEYDGAMGRGRDTLWITLEALTSYSVDEVAEQNLETFLNGADLKSVLEVDQTLSGTAQKVQVHEMLNYGPIRAADGTAHFGCRFRVEITPT